MYSCWGVRLSAIQRFNSNGGMQIQVTGMRLKGDITCALHNHRKLSCNRQLYEDFDENHPRLLGFRVGGRIKENTPLSFKSWGSKRFIQTAHLGQLTEGTRRSTPCVSLATSAQSSHHRNRHNTGSHLFWETASDTHTRRLQSPGVVGPVLLTSGAGRFRLLFPATGVQTRASSTAAAQKRETVPEDTAADLKADQPQGGVPGKGPGGPEGPEPEEPKPNKTQQLKKVFKEYGAVGVSFHVGISLLSLGMCYLAISSGIDMAAILFKLGFSESVVRSKMAAGTSTFVLAYAVHKLFAPVRISITLVSVPLIVRYFRKTGLFKPPATPP
ncbi:protein FAM210B, mitochondrial [Anguilla rostrata]|uniref:protein FAM210B, mitochondrial n=1 Tax=Anguilla rostrata TaxID=7938 RepID=UPI0030D0B4E9